MSMYVVSLNEVNNMSMIWFFVGALVIGTIYGLLKGNR